MGEDLETLKSQTLKSQSTTTTHLIELSGSQNLRFSIRYTMNEKVPPTASNRRKRELAKEGDLVTYKRKRKTIDLSIIVPPNTVGSANEGVSEGVNIPTEFVEGVNIPQGSEFVTESAQVGLGAQPPLPNVVPDFDENIHIFGGYSEAGGAKNSLSLKKLKEHYAYKLEKVLSDGTAAAAKKKKGLTARSIARAYMLWQRSGHGDQQFWLTCITIWVQHLEMMRDNSHAVPCYSRYGGITLLNFREALDNYKLEDTTICPITVDLAANDFGIHQRKPASVNEHGDTPVHQSEDIAEQYDASTSECDLLKETIEQMKAEIKLKRVVDEQCALEFTDLPRQLDAKILECKNVEEKNTSLEVELRSKSGLEDCNQSLYVELNKKRQKLVNAEERMKSLEANNSEWFEVIVVKFDDYYLHILEFNNIALKKALASEGMGDMGNPTFEELFELNERFFIIAQQGPKGDYQEDLVSMMVTLKNVIIARREKMAKKKKMQELLFQPWTKYLVDARGVKISDNNSSFRVTAAIQYQSQHRFPGVMKSLKTFLCKDPAFWKSIFSQTLSIQFTADGENAYQILLQACSYGHQHVEYRDMAHLLATYYEMVVVFISHTEAYTFLPLLPSNEERFQNLVMDTS
ncbi:hypothetical protein GIB67_007658 [Kingdonia uniflora]|uniref:Uncharacterized protein n=1 Tax=Kingdonia uniflora TaxID=39325 RepID=A0A7J7N1M8_9MAGN|nr:hypothetical protein GIB67_007658 [Kingdonia uniflora]